MVKHPYGTFLRQAAIPGGGGGGGYGIVWYSTAQ